MPEQILDFLFKITPSQFSFAIFITVVLIYIAKKSWVNSPSGTDIDDDKEDPELIADMENAKSAEDLMDAVNDHHESDCLMDNENDVFLRKAWELNICRHDWAEAYRFAEEGSQLENVAKEKAGNALD